MGGVDVNINTSKAGGTGTTVGVAKSGVGVGVNPGNGKLGGTTIGIGKGGVGVHVNNPCKKSVNVNVYHFLYAHTASETQVHDDLTTPAWRSSSRRRTSSPVRR